MDHDPRLCMILQMRWPAVQRVGTIVKMICGAFCKNLVGY